MLLWKHLGLILFLSALRMPCSLGQLFPIEPLITEVLGQARQYRPDGDIPTQTNCTHPVLIPRPNIRNLLQITSCFLEVFERGKIRRRPDHGMRTHEVILSHGYNLVTYSNVTSKDGYIQTVFRITGGPKSPPRKGKPVVLLFHGTFSASDAWFLLGENSLPFVLVNADLDVWVINNRGTDYSIKHVYYDAVWDKNYWNFSFHEMGVIDLPLYLDLIQSETGQEKIFFICHSTGCSALAVALSENPDLNKSFHAAFFFGAPLVTKYSKSLARLLAIFMELPPRVQRFLYDDVFRGQLSFGNWFVNEVSSRFCSSTAITCGLCGAVYTLSGLGNKNLEYVRIPNLLSRILNSVAIKVWLHTGQNYRSCKFQKFDYGVAKNLKLYGQREPPLYNLANLRVPIYMYYSDTDMDVTPKDLQLLVNALPPGTVKSFNRINATIFSHIDFATAYDAKKLVYTPVVHDIQRILNHTTSLKK